MASASWMIIRGITAPASLKQRGKGVAHLPLGIIRGILTIDLAPKSDSLEYPVLMFHHNPSCPVPPWGLPVRGLRPAWSRQSQGHYGFIHLAPDPVLLPLFF